MNDLFPHYLSLLSFPRLPLTITMHVIPSFQQLPLKSMIKNVKISGPQREILGVGIGGCERCRKSRRGPREKLEWRPANSLLGYGILNICNLLSKIKKI